MKKRISLILVLALACSAAAFAQRPDPQVQLAAQREAMAKLAMLDGVWRGPAATTMPNGDVHKVTQTERAGPFLDGAVRVIEGRGYNDSGQVAFNAFGTIYYDPASKSYSMVSHAMGSTGTFPVKVTDDGFVWSIPAGPMTIRYTATIKGGVWHEVGERLMADKPPIQFFEMTLKRLSDSDWPAAGAVPMH